MSNFQHACYSENVFLSVLSSDDFLPGVIILYLSLKKYSKYPLVVLCSNGLSKQTYDTLECCGITFFLQEDHILPDSILQAPPEERKRKFGDWQNTFFKLNMFSLEQFKKVCYLDCDMIVAGNIDHLFDYPDFSAVSDAEFYCKESDGLNSGLIVFRPKETNTALFQEHIMQLWNNGPWPFGDQDVLSVMQEEWRAASDRHIPVNYNACVGRLVKYDKNIGKIYVYHYANHYKPWNMKYGYMLRIAYCISHFQGRTLRAILLAYFYNNRAKRFVKEKTT